MIKRWLIISFAIIGLLTTGVVEGQYKTPQSQSALVSAKRMLESNQPDSVPVILENNDLGVLNLYRQWLLAKAYFQLNNFQKANQILQGMLTDYPDSPLWSYAFGLGGRCFYGLGDYQSAVQRLQHFLRRFPQHPLTTECSLDLARSLVKTQRIEEALSKYLDIILECPTFSQYSIVVDEYYQLCKTQGRSPYAIDDSQLLGWARVDLTYGRYTHLLQLATEFTKSTGAKATDNIVEIKYLEAQTLEQFKRTEAAKELYRLIIIKYSETPWASQSLASLVKMECKADRTDRAIQLLKDMELMVSESFELSQAKVTLGKTLYWDREYSKARPIFERLQANLDDQVNRPDALWYLAWTEWKTRRPYQAKQYWEMLKNDYPQSSYYPGAVYWYTRALQKTGPKQEPQFLLTDIAEKYPHTYYGILARIELNHLSPDNPTSVVMPMSTENELQPFPILGDTSKSAERYQFLIDLGLLDFAIMEGESLSVWSHYPEWDCQKALLGLQMGLKWKGYQKARKSLETTRLPSQTVANILYPTTYSDVIEGVSQRWSISPGWILALIRQESGFDESAISEDGAVGLLQVMPATARWVTKKYQLPNWQKLSNPTINITIGAAYIDNLLSQFNEAVIPAIAAFNAGPGAVNRWLQSSNNDPAELVESISYTETRNFVKRVVINAWTYAQLYPEQALFIP